MMATAMILSYVMGFATAYVFIKLIPMLEDTINKRRDE